MTERILEALLYRLLSVGLSYPEDVVIRDLREIMSFNEEEIRSFNPKIKAHLDLFANNLSEIHENLLQQEFTQMFSNKAVCPMHERSWNSQGFSITHLLADVAGFYHAFGFKLAEFKPEMPDNIAVEMEFMSIMCIKRAYAHEADKADCEDVCKEAQKKFLCEHLGRWAIPFFESVRKTATSEFYKSLSKLGSYFIQAQFEVFDVKPIEATRPTMVIEESELVDCACKAGEARVTEQR